MAAGNPKYNVYLGLNFDNFTKGAQEATRVGKKIDRMLKSMEQKTNNVTIGEKKLKRMRRDGKISAEQYHAALAKLRHEKVKETEKTMKAIAATDKEVIAHNKAKRAVEARMRAQEKFNKINQMKNLSRVHMAGSMASGFGLGGKYAGAARAGATMGLMRGSGMVGTAGMAGAFMGIAKAAEMAKRSVTSFAELEVMQTKLNTLMGEDVAGPMVAQFRDLARVTPLTVKGLADSAAIWKSYGLTTEGITDRMRRLGEVSGGNAEKMRLLTTAFAQVNAQGRLMGQEKNQLINAGMNLKEVAKAAGIEMTDFAKAMEEGRITADHLNQALETMTNEGGSHFGFMADQADTLNGRIDVMNNTWEEMYASIGKFFASSGLAQAYTDTMTGLAAGIRDVADAISDLNKQDLIIKDADGKIIMDPSKAAGTGAKHGRLQKGIEGTDGYRGSSFFSSTDSPYANDYYADAIAAQAANNKMYGQARPGQEYQDAADALNRKTGYGDKKVTHADEAIDNLAERQAEALNEVMKPLFAEQSRIFHALERNKHIRGAIADGKDPRLAAMYADHYMQQQQIQYSDLSEEDKEHAKRMNTHNYKRKEANFAHILADEKKIKDHQKAIEDIKAKADAKSKDLKDNFIKDEAEKAGMTDEDIKVKEALIKGPALKGQNAFTGGSAAEFQFISKMMEQEKGDSEMKQLQEDKKDFDEKMTKKLEDKLEELKGQQETDIKALQGEVEKLNGNIANREL